MDPGPSDTLDIEVDLDTDDSLLEVEIDVIVSNTQGPLTDSDIEGDLLSTSGSNSDLDRQFLNLSLDDRDSEPHISFRMPEPGIGVEAYYIYETVAVLETRSDAVELGTQEEPGVAELGESQAKSLPELGEPGPMSISRAIKRRMEMPRSRATRARRTTKGTMTRPVPEEAPHPMLLSESDTDSGLEPESEPESDSAPAPRPAPAPGRGPAPWREPEEAPGPAPWPVPAPWREPEEAPGPAPVPEPGPAPAAGPGPPPAQAPPQRLRLPNRKYKMG